jgi:large subunit ribosomal protein L2
MIIKIYNPYTPSMRQTTTLVIKNISYIKKEKKLIKYIKRSYGRNNEGKITCRHKQRGHKKLYRIIDFKRNKFDIYGIVKSIEYDPNRNVKIALILYADGEKRYILCPENLQINDKVISSQKNISLNIGNSLKLEYIPIGIFIHNIEINFKKGGQLIRSAGTFAKILGKKNNLIIIKLASKKLRLFKKDFLATIGRLSNSDFCNINIGKAGRNRWLGKRPTVRGSAMNAVDHPHGGGEGKASIGKKNPKTPWGKIALGYKTRKKRKNNYFFIKNINSI